MSFKATEASAPALFEAQGRRGSASLYQINHAYAPAQALVAYRLTLQREGQAGIDDVFDMKEAGQGRWWVIQREAQGHERLAMLITTRHATWVVSLQGADRSSPEQAQKTLRTLAGGISPELRPELTALPDLPLGQALGAPSVVSLDPPDTTGASRSASLRPLAAPSTLIEGHALAEPLTYPLSTDAYLARLIERYAAQIPELPPAPTEIESCGPGCRVASLNAGAWTYTLAAQTSEREARHLLLWHPSWANTPAFLAPRQAWVDAFGTRAGELLEVPTP